MIESKNKKLRTESYHSTIFSAHKCNIYYENYIILQQRVTKYVASKNYTRYYDEMNIKDIQNIFKMTIILLNRVLKNTKYAYEVDLEDVFLGCLYIASKWLDDYFKYNKEFFKATNIKNKRYLLDIEYKILLLLEWNIFVSMDEIDVLF